MSEHNTSHEVSDADLRAALSEMGSYIDITPEDLKNIYSIALKHAKQRSELSRTVAEIMSINVVVISPDAAVADAARQLAEHGISGMPVVDSSGAVIGIITEADILSCAGIDRKRTIMDFIKIILGTQQHTHKLDECFVKDVMTENVVTVTPDADIKQAAALMAEKAIKRLPVVGPDKKLAGIISRADIVSVFGVQPAKGQKSRG